MRRNGRIPGVVLFILYLIFRQSPRPSCLLLLDDRESEEIILHGSTRG